MAKVMVLNREADSHTNGPGDESSVGNGGSKKVDIRQLFNLARKCKFVAPTMTRMEDLPQMLADEGWESDLKIPPKLLRRDQREDGIPAGEWEVEAIVDAGMDDDGSIRYLVRWKGWEGSDTWEPAGNLSNSSHLVREYLNTVSKRDEIKSHKDLIRLVLVLTKVTKNQQPDKGLLLKLCQKDVTYSENTNWVKELQKFLAHKCTLALDFLIRGPGELGTPGALLETTMKELKINDTFGSLDDMFEWIERREEQESGNKKRMEEINAAIEAQGDGPPVFIENYIDDAIVPQFKYVKEYEPFEITYNSNPVIKCTCTDCFEVKKPRKGQEGFCCWHE